ncbi:hypothetical protein GBA65_15175 [Rubrobacter marinus]|uniref:GyrI-like small molecule binding domain-containing protein n=2 Tax=Rubrobacter marinus TaxID=2653852 RepID=A0A6G8Q306_9ACTN|nr:hypothetical protein GBA65_15175 [Rubrobacter marinus]
MRKVDLRKKLKHLYGPTAKEVVEVEVPEMRFLMVDGQGNPNTSEAFKDAVEALYALSYALKFAVKKEQGVDYGVMPLEGLWQTDGRQGSFEEIQGDKEAWKWTLMIMQPEWVGQELYERALVSVGRKKNLPGLRGIRFEAFREGRAAQVMHVGPFSEEGPTIEGVVAFVAERGGGMRGKHHEIYLNDFRRTAPERLKTVVRHPF